MNNEQLDETVVALARAIKRQETSGAKDAYNAKGASGEFGAYQFMPDTWKKWSGEFLGDSNAPMTIENQNKVAYNKVKQLKDKGYNPAQIAAAWNAGEGALQNDEWKTRVGVNKFGVKYDTPSYVANVSKYYQELKPNQTPLGPNEVRVPGVEKPFNYGSLEEAVARQNPENNDFLPNVADTVTNPLLKIAYGVANRADRALGTGVPERKSFTSPFTNKKQDVPGYIDEQQVSGTEEAKQYGGALLQSAATLLPFTKAGTAAFKAAPLLSSLGVGYGTDVGENLSEGKDLNIPFTEDSALTPGINTVVGGGIGIFAKGAQVLAKPIAQAREEAFLSGIDELRNRTQRSENAFNKNTITRTTDSGEKVITPTETWMQKGAPIPTVSTEGGTASTRSKEAIDFFNDLIGKEDEKLITQLNKEGFNMSTADIRKIADQIVKSTDSIEGVGTGKVTRESVAETLNNRITNLSKEYGDTWSGEGVRKILKAANGDFKEDSKDVSRLLGDSMREIMYNYTTTGRKALNQMQELISARNFAQEINGKKVAGGGLGRMFARGVGMTLAGVSNLGPLGVLLGGETAAGVGKLLQKGTFISVPAEVKTKLLKLFKAEGASEKEIKQLEKVLKVTSQASENKVDISRKREVPTNQSLRTYLMGGKDYVPEQYIPDADLPVIDAGPSPQSKYQKVDKNLPNIQGSISLDVLKKLGLGTGAGVGLTAANENLAESNRVRYEAQEEPVTTTVSAPTVVQTKKDRYGDILKLDSGIEVRPADRFADAVKMAYREFPNLPKGFIESVIMKESSMGTLGQKHNNPGKYGYLVAITKPTLESIKIAAVSDPRYRDLVSKMKFDTPEEAIRAAAAYADFRSKIFDKSGKVVSQITDPVELYVDRYHAAPSTGRTKEKADTFKKMFDFYSQQEV